MSPVLAHRVVSLPIVGQIKRQTLHRSISFTRPLPPAPVAHLRLAGAPQTKMPRLSIQHATCRATCRDHYFTTAMLITGTFPIGVSVCFYPARPPRRPHPADGARGLRSDLGRHP